MNEVNYRERAKNLKGELVEYRGTTGRVVRISGGRVWVYANGEYVAEGVPSDSVRRKHVGGDY